MYSRVKAKLNPCHLLSACNNKLFYRRTTAVIVLCVFVYIYCFHFRHKISSKRTRARHAADPNTREHELYADFMATWCRLKRARFDWESVLHPCRDNMEWGNNKKNWSVQNRTDATKCYLTLFDIRPCGQFSRFSIQSVSRLNIDKTIGGDSWRVHIRGPSSLSPSVVDHNNGTYEVLFLVLEPGTYEVEVILEYSMCDGYKDPPKDWFIKGNAQGRYQHPRTLPGYDRPFLLSPLWGGAPFVITIQPAVELLFQKALNKYGTLDAPCGFKCFEMRDGFGRWVNESWKPFVEGGRIKPYIEVEFRRAKKKRRTEKLRTLWIYGDSVGDFFFKSIVNQPLCRTIFKSCNSTYNWVYKITDRNLTRARLENDDLDFSIERVFTEIFDVASNPYMDESSVVILNLGLHYVHTINFTTYIKLIDKTIRLLTKEFKTSQARWRFKGKVIWKTTTAINMEKYGDPRTNARHSTSIRFLTYQRVMLFNAYAMRAMCTAGVELLDVFPISDAYPGGTGLPNKPYDAVHYKGHVFQSVINLLQRYFGNY